jgi:hypothetical protein
MYGLHLQGPISPTRTAKHVRLMKTCRSGTLSAKATKDWQAKREETWAWPVVCVGPEKESS